MHDDKWIKGVLDANKSRGFVKRILRTDNYTPLDNQDGTTSTHSMAYGSADDGKTYAFPTVLMNSQGSLQRFSDNDAWRMAHATGNAIPFDSEEDAAFFAENYKRAWADDFLKPKGKSRPRSSPFTPSR